MLTLGDIGSPERDPQKIRLVSQFTDSVALVPELSGSWDVNHTEIWSVTITLLLFLHLIAQQVSAQPHLVWHS